MMIYIVPLRQCRIFAGGGGVGLEGILTMSAHLFGGLDTTTW